MREIINQLTDGVIIIDKKCCILTANPAVEQIFGFTGAELIGIDANQLLSDPQLTSVGKVEHNNFDHPLVFGVVHEAVGRRKDGGEFPVELTLNQIHVGDRMLFSGVIRDITETKFLQESLWSTHDELESRVQQRTEQLQQANQALQVQVAKFQSIQQALQASEERLRVVVTSAPVILFAIDPNGVFTLSEGRGLERIGIKPGGLVGHSVYEVFEHIPEFADDFVRALAGEKISPLLEINDIIFEYWYTIVYGKHNEIDGLIGVAIDITERKRAEDRLVQLANYDALTGMPNRALFRDRLTHAIAQAHRNKRLMALLFLDLDRFKMINDSLGHHVGDELLKAVAERLKCNARANDTVARLGGDEFTVILEGVTDIEDPTTVARKILDVMSKPFYLDGHEVFVTASLGITVYPLDGRNIDDLLKNADTAMYRAKEQGRNNYQFYTEDMNAQAVEHLILESSLRHALERHEFILHFQPQVDLHSREITGMEALLRWAHPEFGLLQPAQFIPLAEETGLITSIGTWVLEAACTQAVAWQSEGLANVRIAVNLSARQFRQENLVEIVSKTLADTGLNPQFLELEITESFLLDNVDSAISTLKKLHNLGVQISIDDFGTGYSSLSYLRRLPLNSLKIDQSFVHDISAKNDDAAIAEAIIAMAQSLRLRVMAEGVETEEQLYFLRTRGCDYGQGFLICRPIPAEEILAWCKATDANRHSYKQGALFLEPALAINT